MSIKATKYTFPPTENEGNDFCTIGSLLDNREQFALPHFQRGSVWNDDAKSKLLESLTLNTPCGSIILWEPEGFESHKEKHGSLVKDWSGSNWETVRYLVVDGQQRLTNLSQIFRTTEKNQWTLNLVKIPSLKDAFSQIDISSFLQKKNLFTKPPKAPPPTQANQINEDTNNTYKTTYENRMKLLMPLNDIITDNYEVKEQTELGCSYIRSQDSNILYVHPEITTVVQDFLNNIKGIEARILQVIIKDKNSSLMDIIELYNRINSSGVIVQEEERAFASLTKTGQMNPNWLKELFIEIHGQQELDLDRDEILQRQREKNFGFKLIIRTIGQVVAYHMNEKRYDLSRLDGYIDRIEKYHHKEYERHWNKIFEDTKRVLTTTSRILKETLMCDDLRFLPTAQGLRPIFALLLRFKQVPNDAVARALLICQLPDTLFANKQSVEDMVERIRHCQDFESAMNIFPEVQFQELYKSLKESRSVQNPWVSILYWMQRKIQTKDYVTQHPIQDNMACQIEHIVPFSYLKIAYKEDHLQQRDRNRSHDANSLGNLTFLTREGNLKHMNELVALHTSNVNEMLKHQLNTSSLQIYGEIFNTITVIEKPISKNIYENFIHLRLQELKVQFEDWLKDNLQTFVTTEPEINYSSIVKSLPAIISDLNEDADWSATMIEQYKKLLSHYRRKSGYDFVVFNNAEHRTQSKQTIRVKRLYTYKKDMVREPIEPQIMIGVAILQTNLTQLSQFITDSITDTQNAFKNYSSIDFHLTRGQSQGKSTTSGENMLKFKCIDQEIEIEYIGKGHFRMDNENSIKFVAYINDTLDNMTSPTK